MEPYVMAFDVGTSGVKTAVIAADGHHQDVRPKAMVP